MYSDQTGNMHDTYMILVLTSSMVVINNSGVVLSFASCTYKKLKEPQLNSRMAQYSTVQYSITAKGTV